MSSINPPTARGGVNQSTPSWLQDDDEEHTVNFNPGQSIGNIPVSSKPSTSLSHTSLSASSNSYTPLSNNNGNQSNSYAPLNHSVDFEKNKNLIHWALKGTTIFLCALMIVTAVLGLREISGGASSSGKVFVATYMIFFASLLLIYEVVDIKKIEWIDHMIKRNFGFLYSTPGKSLFIIFIAFLSFGLENPYTLTLSTGLCWAVFGGLQLGLYLKYPELFEILATINSNNNNSNNSANESV
jgi:hypothetical protein